MNAFDKIALEQDSDKAYRSQVQLPLLCAVKKPPLTLRNITETVVEW